MVWCGGVGVARLLAIWELGKAGRKIHAVMAMMEEEIWVSERGIDGCLMCVGTDRNEGILQEVRF